MNEMARWIIEWQFGLFVGGVCMGLWACLIEGKPVPTFPGCLCRRGPQCQSLTPEGPKAKVDAVRELSGLQFTSTLGKALALLTKHGLDTKRRKEFPVSE